MNIDIQDEADGFTIIVDNNRYHFGQEDDRAQLINVLKQINPSANVTYEVVC